MLKRFKKLAAGVSMALITPLFVLAPVANAAISTETVTQINTQGWVFNGDPGTSTPYNFTDAKASIGEGSLYVEPIGANPSDKFIAAKPVNTVISDIASISYDFMIAGNGDVADANQFYLNVYANLPGSDTFYDCRYDYVPATGSTTNFTPATFNTTDTPVNVASRAGVTCPATLDAMQVGSSINFIALNVGDTSASDVGLAGYLDKVVISAANADVTTYDFEPVLSPTSKDACKNGGWEMFNSPAFKNQGDCVSYAARTKVTETSLNSKSQTGINIATKKDYTYKVTVEGTWTNRPQEIVDAECTSYQDPEAWTNTVFGGYSPDLLDVQINKAFVDWGTCSGDNTYTYWVTGNGKAMNLRVFDGNVETNQQTPDWFDDNSGSLNVTVIAYPKN